MLILGAALPLPLPLQLVAQATQVGVGRGDHEEAGHGGSAVVSAQAAPPVAQPQHVVKGSTTQAPIQTGPMVPRVMPLLFCLVTQIMLTRADYCSLQVCAFWLLLTPAHKWCAAGEGCCDVWMACHAPKLPV